MREILFRGFCKEENKWVYGSLLQSEIDVNEIAVECEIHERFAHDFSIKRYKVDPKSVGEYTGRNDIAGNKVFEGDIVNGYDRDGVHIIKCTIEFRDGCFCLKTDPTVWPNILINKDLEVIGNIYEHAELLK